MGHHIMQDQDRTAPRPRGTTSWSHIVIAILLFCGVSVLLYPSTASWFSQVQQIKDMEIYGQSVEILGPEGRGAALAAAADYNQTLTGGAVLDPFSQLPGSELSAEAERYRNELSLSPDGVMARLQIPAIGVDLPIFHGTSDSVLLRGVGHLFGTAMPVGGVGTHAVLTGHAGLPEATLFNDLQELHIGDLVGMEVYGDVLSYRIASVEVILPTETDSLRPVPGADLLSLVTCTPTGVNTHRLVVTGERVPAAEDVTGLGNTHGELDPPWWAAGIGGAAAVAITMVVLATRRSRAREESQELPQFLGQS